MHSLYNPDKLRPRQRLYRDFKDWQYWIPLFMRKILEILNWNIFVCSHSVVNYTKITEVNYILHYNSNRLCILFYFLIKFLTLLLIFVLLISHVVVPSYNLEGHYPFSQPTRTALKKRNIT